jgi:hypothetical protein
MTTKPIEFRADVSGTLFTATTESDAAPEPSWYQWVVGLPEELKVPEALFSTVKGPAWIHLAVSSCNNACVVREDGAILCEIVGVMGHHMVDALSLLRSEYVASKADVEHTRHAESLIAGAVSAFDKKK